MAAKWSRRTVAGAGIVFWVLAGVLAVFLYRHYGDLGPAVACLVAAYIAFRVFRIAISPYDPNTVILPGASGLHDYGSLRPGPPLWRLAGRARRSGRRPAVEAASTPPPVFSDKWLGRLAGRYWLLVLLILLAATAREGQQYRARCYRATGIVAGTVESGLRRRIERPLFHYTVHGTAYEGWTRNADYPQGARVSLLVDPDDLSRFTVDDGYFWAETFVGHIEWLLAALLFFGVLMAVVVRLRRGSARRVV